MNPDETVTLNRMVHYRSHGTPDGTYGPVCRSAVITEVGEPVGLTVFNPTGLFFNKSTRGTSGGQWHFYWECPDEHND